MLILFVLEAGAILGVLLFMFAVKKKEGEGISNIDTIHDINDCLS